MTGRENPPAVTLREITPENYEAVLSLTVDEGQRDFVSTVAHSLAQAWVWRNTAWPFAVYAGETPVGFLMLGWYEKERYYTIWKLLIDRRFQRRGYGRQALRLGIAFLRERLGAAEIYTGVAFRNDAARRLYRSEGFVLTGRHDAAALELRWTGEKQR